MGYISKNYSNIDQQVFVKVRDKLLIATVVKMPFV
jgi:glycine cleavage system aminomethyltransferase T